MRFLSQLKALHVTVRSHRDEHTALNEAGTPITVPARPALEAQFEHGNLTYEDAALIKAHYPKIIGTNEDEAHRPLDPTYRFSVFDSELAQLNNGWTDDERLEVEEFLKARVGQDFFFVERGPLARPWPNFDEMEAEQILVVAQATDADLKTLIAYEQENEARIEVIEILSEAVESADETIIVQA